MAAGAMMESIRAFAHTGMRGGLSAFWPPADYVFHERGLILPLVR